MEVIPNNFSSSTKDLEANWGPQSEIILSGNPNRLYKFSSNSQPVSLAVIVFLQGVKITPLVSPWSTMTKIESNPLTGGKSVIKSMEQFANGHVD